MIACAHLNGLDTGVKSSPETNGPLLVLSHGRPPAIDCQHRSGHIARLVTGQKQRRVGDFPGPAGSSEESFANLALMQFGTFGTVPVLSAAAALTGRRRLALSLLIGGTTAWFGAKLAKPYGGRPRPAGLLENVRIRETIAGDLGWVSGHTAVATTLALTAADELPHAARPLLGGLVLTTGIGRMYVGAHLPHDLVGGLGLGMMITSVVPNV